MDSDAIEMANTKDEAMINIRFIVVSMGMHLHWKDDFGQVGSDLVQTSDVRWGESRRANSRSGEIEAGI